MTSTPSPAPILLTGPQAFAARILIQLSRAEIAGLAGISVADLTAFEQGRGSLPKEALQHLAHVLETDGAVLIGEDAEGGVGVRLKFNSRDVKALNRWEGEGGQPAEDDV